MKLFFAFLIYCNFLNGIRPYRILMYSPGIGNSHVQFVGRIADILIEGGHNVTILLMHMDPDITEVGSRRANNIHFHPPNYDGSDFLRMNSKTAKIFDPAGRPSDSGRLYNGLARICDDLIADQPLIDRLRLEQFNIGMSEMYEYCGDGLFELVGIRTQIRLSAIASQAVNQAFGIPTAPSFVPHVFTPFTDRMSYVQRAKNVYMAYYIDWLLYRMHNAQLKVFRRRVDPNFKKLLDIRRIRSALAFVNYETVLEFEQPITNKVYPIGGMGSSTVKPLPKFSDYQFIWKYSKAATDISEVGFENATNVHPIAWIPQLDLLNHPKCRLFITHAGMNSVLESVRAGVPMIVAPLFADQHHNAATVVSRGVGRLLRKTDFNENGLTMALKELLTEKDSKYHKKVRRMASMIAKKLLKPNDVVLQMTEYVGEFGVLEEFDLACRDQNWLTYYCLDIIVPLSVSVVLALIIVMKLFVFILRRMISLLFLQKKIKPE